jgi:hypothetical protein
MRAACSLALFDQFGDEADRKKPSATWKRQKHWALYATVYGSLYKPALYNRVGYVDIPELIKKVEAILRWPGMETRTINKETKLLLKGRLESKKIKFVTI